MVSKTQIHTPKIYLGETPYPITEGLTFEEFKRQHTEFSWDEYNSPCVVTKNPLPYTYIGEKWNHWGEFVTDCYESPTNSIFYNLATNMDSEDSPIPVFDDLVCYIIPNLNYLTDDDGQIVNITLESNLNNIFDFDNCTITRVLSKTSGNTTTFQPVILKYPYNATKVYEPYFYNIKKVLDGKTVDTLTAFSILLASPKNCKITIGDDFTLDNLFLPYGYTNSQQKFYIDYNTDDIIHCIVDEEEKQFTIEELFTDMLRTVLEISTYDDTDILVFNDGEYTIAQLKEKYKVS